MEHTTGVYRLDGNVVAAVWNEGGYRGDTYFLFDNRKRAEDTELLEDMIKFSKTFAAGLKEDGRTWTLSIFVPEWHDTLRNTVLSHGFYLGDEEETVYKLPAARKEVCLPEGYVIVDGKVIPFFIYQMCTEWHFLMEIRRSLFQRSMVQRHCKESLTLCVLDREKRPVGMTVIWYDKEMPYCEMEPLAVVWWERRKGIATALIHEAINRILDVFPECEGITGGE